MHRGVIIVPWLTLAVGAAAAQQPSPYAGMTGRAIKALSVEEIRQLEAGDGMGLALAAELNRYPGPRHTLELADSLALSAEQRAAVAAVERRMRERARALGAELLTRERTLDSLFAGGVADSTALRALTGDIGRLTGELRFTHLAAHLAVTDLLTPGQREAYQRLRGYPDHVRGHAH